MYFNRIHFDIGLWDFEKFYKIDLLFYKETNVFVIE